MGAVLLYLAVVLFAVWQICICHAEEPVANTDQHDLIVIGYNSYDARSETLIFASVDENVVNKDGGYSTLNAGMGQHLWQIDESGKELKRGWMFRLRLTIQAVIDEYNRRGKQDFIAMVSDAADVYVSHSLDGNALQLLKERFLNDFADHQIVFSTQIYCCNPWELHTIGRADWDELYEKVGEPDSIYKHLNAGLYMGYASAIIQMADEMQLWDKDYHRHEGFHSLIGTEAEKYLKMEDLEVDDDEWQISAWFFRDQAKETPIATLDFNQHLFAVTGTQRAQEKDEGYVLFSREHFRNMFGPFPSSFSLEQMDQLSVCPYEYQADQKQWSNEITGGHPLVFHFAGNDWLCACTIFAQEGFKGITGKFRENCLHKMDTWFDRVNMGILTVAQDEDTEAGLFLYEKHAESAASTEKNLRRLDSPYERSLDGPYLRSVERPDDIFIREGVSISLTDETVIVTVRTSPQQTLPPSF